jgi:hypothetical protein
MSKQRGYRISVTIFVPCNHNSMDSVKKVTEYAATLEKPGDGAPEGTTVESFQFKGAQKGE